MRDEINSGLVGIVSEGTDYTVDLALALGGKQRHLRLMPIAGAGALQNADDVMFARGVDFAIVQSDVLDEIKRNPPFSGVEKYLRYVTRLYDQELHVLAGPDIQSIEDLRGKKVNFGLRHGGTEMTAMAVFDALGIKPDVTNLPHALALDRLRRGEISALAYVATKPARLFRLNEENFWQMLSCCPAVAKQIFRVASSRVRNLEGYSQQREKLVSLGTMAAGLAH